MKIHVAKSAGFCFGVKRAVQTALETVKNSKDAVYMLGDIVHNEHIIRELTDAGIQVVDSLEQIESGTLLIRAHGTVPEIYEWAKRKDLNIIDATCPLVLEIHKFARQLDEEGYTTVVIGDHGHDEVIGIAGQVASAMIIASPEEADAAFEKISRIRGLNFSASIPLSKRSPHITRISTFSCFPIPISFWSVSHLSSSYSLKWISAVWSIFTLTSLCFPDLKTSSPGEYQQCAKFWA